LHNFIQNNFNSWQLGLRLDMPLGFRDANALVRQAQLNLYRSYYQLADTERKAIEFLVSQYRRVLETNELIRVRRAQRIDLEKFVALEVQFRQIGDPKATYETTILNLIQAQRDLANATAQEFQAIADYNISLASLEFAIGTIQRYNNVTVADGPLPQHVGKKAADHFRAREAALKVREHPADMPLVPLHQWHPSTDTAPGSLPPPPGAPAQQMPWLPSQPGAPTPVPLQPETAPLPKSKEVPGGTPISASTTGGSMPPAASDAAFRPIGTLTLPPSPRRTLPADATPAPAGSPSTGGVPTVALPPAAPR
jgi:hypothetical protein